VHRRDATDLGARPGGADEAFNVALLDPPYRKGLGERALAKLLAGNWLSPGALCVMERAADEPDLSPPGYERLDERTYGAAKVMFLRRSSPVQPPLI
jgi:16S rRNA (guanine966-N2)-methyltransferase